MQSKNKKQIRLKQSFKYRDDRLLLLQKNLTDKISKARDEHLIKLYLQQVQQISQERLSLRKLGQ